MARVKAATLRLGATEKVNMSKRGQEVHEDEAADLKAATENVNIYERGQEVSEEEVHDDEATYRVVFHFQS